MKKVRLKALDLGAAELLDAEQQKVTFGSGSGSGSGSGDPNDNCTCNIKTPTGWIILDSEVTDNWNTEELCKTRCKQICDSAKQVAAGSGSGSGSNGGGCLDWSWTTHNP